MILSAASASQAFSLLQGLRHVFRGAGAELHAQPADYDRVADGVRIRLDALIHGANLGEEAAAALAYPLRASRRFVGGENYSVMRFFALERCFLARVGYLRGVVDAALPLEAETIPSPPPVRSLSTMPVSRPPSFDDCKILIGAGESVPALSDELSFVDLVPGKISEVRRGNHSVAATVIDLPMSSVLERVFSRTFDIGENRGDVPGFWAEKVTLSPSLPGPDKPAVRISCDLASADDLRAFVIAVQALLNIPNPIEIDLEGRFEWREGVLFIPLTPVRLSEGIIPADTLFGTVTPILAPIGTGRTILAIDMEDKLLSKNPAVFVSAMARGMA